MEIEQIYTELSAGRLPDDRTDLRASRIYSLLEDPFTIWCEYHAPREMLAPEPSKYDEIRFHNDKKLREELMRADYGEPVRIEAKPHEAAFKATLEAMSKGAKAIAYPVLWNLQANIYGRTGLIVRSESASSRFGPYHYFIAQYKQALELKTHYCLQTVLLNRILGAIQGYEPAASVVVLRNKREEVAQSAWNDKLDEIIRLWTDIKDGNIEPEPNRPPNAANPPWRKYANKVVFERKDLVLLPNIGWDTRAKLREGGLKSTEDIAAAGLERVNQLVELSGKEIYASAMAYRAGVPILKTEGLFPPKRGHRNLYFDFEAADPINSGMESHIYLIGVWDKEKEQYKAFLAKGGKDEEKIFTEFLDYIGDPSQAVLYHWTDYELSELKEAAAKYPAIRERIKAILQSCLDLKEIVKKAFYLPAPSLSLKTVAPAFGFNWRQDDCDAMDSMIYYWQWLENGNESGIAKVLMYNEDDCIAMLHVDKYLESVKPARLPD